MKKTVQKVIALVMTVIVACQFQVPTFAASEAKEYVSKLVVSYGEGDAAEADAKAWLTDNGYQVIDVNLNNGAESGASSASWLTGARSARAVYLGYETTTDVSEAITSIKAMNMTGSYSFDDYQAIIDDLREEATLFMDNLEITLKEWRDNYNAGRGKAVEAYALLNLMYSPDNGNMKMGDLLLNETKEEMGEDAYNKLSDEEKLQHVDMTTILMEGNSDATKYIEQLLAMGCDTKDSSWIERVEKMGTYDDMMDTLEQSADVKGETFIPSEAAAELSAKYDDAAQSLAVKILALQDLFKEYQESGTSVEDDENKISKYINGNDDAADIQKWMTTGFLYETLAAYKYPSSDNPDRTLQDFFMQSFDPLDESSREELYPIIACLSEGQKAAMDFVTLSELITQGALTDEEVLNLAEGVKQYVSTTDAVSVFAGVDRSIYETADTALTSSARNLQNSSGTSYTEGVFGTIFSIQTTVAASIFAASLIGMAGCAITAAVFKSQASPLRVYELYRAKVAADISKTPAMLEASADTIAKNVDFNCKRIFERAFSNEGRWPEYIQGYEDAYKYMGNPEYYQNKATLLKYFHYATAAMVVVTIAMGVWTVISGINDLKAYYNTDMDLYPIPERMVDESETDSGEMAYTFYYAVQSNRVEKGYTKDREALKDNADLNGDLGKEWLALYYTKDTNAGDPVMVSDISGFKVIKGAEATPEGMTALTIFNQENPVNLTNADWVWNDVNGGLYLYYTVDSAAHTASVFDSANMWVVYVGAGVLIAAIFFFGGLAVGRKRKSTKATA